MKKLIGLIAFIAALTLSSVAYAQAQYGTHLGIVGPENHGVQAYVGIVENPNGCLYGGIYFVVPSEVSKVLAIALTAKATDRTVRIDFNQPSGVATQCFGYGIYLE